MNADKKKVVLIVLAIFATAVFAGLLFLSWSGPESLFENATGVDADRFAVTRNECRDYGPFSTDGIRCIEVELTGNASQDWLHATPFNSNGEWRKGPVKNCFGTNIFDLPPKSLSESSSCFYAKQEREDYTSETIVIDPTINRAWLVLVW